MRMADVLSQNRRLRRLVIPALARFNVGDVTITHHWTGDRVRLHSFRHKSYWFHGRDRERVAMLSLIRLIGGNDVVYDVGGHIGYTALLFSNLGRKVHVFEPGSNNLPYLYMNVGRKPNVIVIESAAGAKEGTGSMLVEDLSGQNNTLAPSAETFRSTSKNAFVHARSGWEPVAITTLDTHAGRTEPPDVVKIDVEGYELEVLRGAQDLLRNRRPIFMVEVTAGRSAVGKLMASHGYGVFREDLLDLGEEVTAGPNHFFLHREQHQALIDRYGKRDAAVR